MRFCTQCGSQLPPDARFCTSCGATVAVATSQTGPTQPTNAGRTTPANPFEEATQAAPVSEPITRKLPTSGGAQAPQASPRPSAVDEEATHVGPASVKPSTPAPTHSAPHAPGYPPPQSARPAPATTPVHESAPPVYPPVPPAQSAQTARTTSTSHGSSAPHQQQSAAQAPGQPSTHQGFPQQGSANPGYAAAPYGSAAPGPDSAPPSGPPYFSAQSGGGAPSAGITLDWKPLVPGLLRVLAAVALSMTALGNYWTTAMDSDPATHSHVLALIGCIGVTLSALAQLALLPQFLGGTLPAIARLGIRAALCLPAVVAIVIALVTTMGGLDSDKNMGISVSLLAMAVGFALVGLDDAQEALPHGVLGWIAAGAAGLGIALTVLSMIQVLSFDSEDPMTPSSAQLLLSGKSKWLLAMPALLLVVAVGALIIWVVFSRVAFGHGLVCAMAAGITISMLTHSWMEDDFELLFITVWRNGHGLPLIALALALATSAAASRVPGDDAADPSSAARRLTSWVVQGYACAAVAALVAALGFFSTIGEGATGGVTWYAVLMVMTALGYGACAFLLRTHVLGRVVALGVTAALSLTILITYAAARGVAGVNDPFSEGLYLWLPVLAICALTLPPSVRAVAGPIMPARNNTAAQSEQGQVR